MPNRATEAYARPGEDSIIDVIDPHTGLTWIQLETADQVRARYPTAERINIAEWAADKAAKQDSPITWLPTTKALYFEMLEILPPALWIGGAFLVGEPVDHHATSGQPRFEAYWERGLSSSTRTYHVASRPMMRTELRKAVDLR